MVCAYPNCERPVRARGFCIAHYNRGRLTGVLPKLERIPRPPKPKRPPPPPRPTHCTVEGCDRPPKPLGLCQFHYVRQWRHGTTADPRQPAADRFWAKVDKSAGDDGCWMWNAKRNWMGYGNFWFEGRGWMAHRWAYHHLVSPVDADLELDHLCRNRACVNPAHLEPVTGRENILRGQGAAAKNARKTECKRGHPFTPENTGRTGGGGRYCKQCRHDANLVWFATHEHPQRRKV